MEMAIKLLLLRAVQVILLVIGVRGRKNPLSSLRSAKDFIGRKPYVYRSTPMTWDIQFSASTDERSLALEERKDLPETISFSMEFNGKTVSCEVHSSHSVFTDELLSKLGVADKDVPSYSSDNCVLTLLKPQKLVGMMRVQHGYLHFKKNETGSYTVLPETHLRIDKESENRRRLTYDKFDNCYEGQGDVGVNIDVGVAVTHELQEDEDLENNEDIRNFVNSVIQEVNLIFDGQMDFKFSVNSLEVGDGSTDWEEPFKELECGKLPESKTDKLFDLLKDGELGREGSWHVFDVCKDSDAETYTSGRAKTGALCKTTGNAYSRCYEGGCDNLWETVAHEYGHLIGGRHPFEHDKTLNGTFGGIMDYNNITWNGVTQFRESSNKKNICDYLDARISSTCSPFVRFDGQHRIYNLHSGLCMDWHVFNDNVYGRSCHGGNNQKWVLAADKTIRSPHGLNMCLDHHTGNNNVYMNKCHGGNNQKWEQTSSGELKSLHDSSMCLDWFFKNHNGNLYMHSCHGGSNQKFYLGDGCDDESCDYKFLLTQQDNLCTDMNLDSKNVYMRSCHLGDNQLWNLKDGLLKVRHDPTLCLEWEGSNENVRMSRCNPGKQKQMWYFQGEEIKSNADSEKCLDYHPGTKNIYMHTCNGGPNQKFKFQRCPKGYELQSGTCTACSFTCASKSRPSSDEVCPNSQADCVWLPQKVFVRNPIHTRYLRAVSKTSVDSAPDPLGQEKWEVIRHGTNSFSFRSFNGQYLRAQSANQGGQVDLVPHDSTYEKWEVVEESGRKCLKSVHGTYLRFPSHVWEIMQAAACLGDETIEFLDVDSKQPISIRSDPEPEPTSQPVTSATPQPTPVTSGSCFEHVGRLCRNDVVKFGEFEAGCTYSDKCTREECLEKCSLLATCQGFEYTIRRRSDRVVCELHTTSVDYAVQEPTDWCYRKEGSCISKECFTHVGEFCRNDVITLGEFKTGCELGDSCTIDDCMKKCSEDSECKGFEFTTRSRRDRVTCELHTTTVDSAKDDARDWCYRKINTCNL